MNSQYHAFLLRMQRSKSAKHWRMTVENAHTGEKVHFASEEDLMRFLWQLVGEGRLLLTSPLTQPENPPIQTQHNFTGRK
jgi:hypothetical protein